MQRRQNPVTDGTLESTYHTIALRDPPTPGDISAYRELRLLALRTDPASFGASYEKEKGYSQDVWRSRLDRKGDAATIIARLDGPTEPSQASPRDASRYGGIVTIVAGTGLVPLDGPLPRHADRKRAYLICGMWVHYEHRRRGVGEKVVEGAVEWARRNARMRGITDGEVWLNVFPENERARGLYEKLGFKQVGDEEELVPGRMIVAMVKSL